jgi:hypothetical protein
MAEFIERLKQQSVAVVCVGFSACTVIAIGVAIGYVSVAIANPSELRTAFGTATTNFTTNAQNTLDNSLLHLEIISTLMMSFVVDVDNAHYQSFVFDLNGVVPAYNSTISWALAVSLSEIDNRTAEMRSESPEFQNFTVQGASLGTLDIALPLTVKGNLVVLNAYNDSARARSTSILISTPRFAVSTSCPTRVANR